jgi:hypothetical protein
MAVTKKKLLQIAGANSYMKTDLAFRALEVGTNLSFSSNAGVVNQVGQLDSNITIRQIDTFEIS